MVIRTIAWLILVPVFLIGMFAGYEALDAGSSIQSLSVQSDGSIKANKRDGSTSNVITDGTTSTQNIKGTLKLGDPGVINGFIHSDDDIYIRPDADDNGTNFIVFRKADDTTGMLFHGDNGDMEIQARDDGNCGVGNVCSGASSGVPSVTGFDAGLDSASAGKQQNIRVGNIVTMGFQVTITIATGTPAAWTLTLGSLPHRSTSFGGSYDATGSCVPDANSGESTAPAMIRASTTAAELIVIQTGTTLPNSARNWVCTVVYEAS